MTSVGVDDAPRWAPDPAGRNAQRYWDGARWTEFVAGPVGGAPTVDPLPDGAAFASPSGEVSLAPEPDPSGVDPGRPAASDGGLGPTPEPATRPAGWERDPTGRHAQRYWDGTAWTEHVAGAAGGAPTSDPIDADLLPVTTAPVSTPDASTVRATPSEDPSGETVTDPPDATVEPEPSPPRWATDPSGRSPQRYWNGAAWTPFVAGAAGGDATVDALPVEPWPAPAPPAADASPAGAAAGRRTGRRKLVATLVVVAVLAAAAAATLLAGVVGGGGSPTRNTAHRGPASTKPKAAAAGPKVAGTSVTAPATAPKAALVNASSNPCGLLTQADIAAATGFSVYPGQALAGGGGCAWRGANPFVNEANAQDRETLGGQEGVILAVQPKGTRHPSVICTASIPGVSGSGGVCTVNGDGNNRYVMFEASGGSVIEIAVHTASPVTNTGLEQLARAAHQRTG